MTVAAKPSSQCSGRPLASGADNDRRLGGERAAQRRLELEGHAATTGELGVHHGLGLVPPIHGATS